MTKIWIIGDWQLGQLTAKEANDMWVETIVYWMWGENSPAWQVSKILDSDWYKANSDKIDEFINENPDAITIEWENVPVDLLERFEKEWLAVRPGSWVLYSIQNRLREKAAINEAWANTAKYQEVNTLDDLKNAYSDFWTWILKTTQDGYDGKWQIKIYSEADMEKAIEDMDWKQWIYEQMVNFKMEISVIVWRRPEWEMVAFDPVENIHENWILRTTITPARIEEKTSSKAKQIAMKIADSMWIEWLLAIEMFVLNDWSILINELAPRPHNSWHPTIESYNKSQYNILTRAILDEPFWELKLIKNSIMTNLLWDEISQIPWRIQEWWKQKMTQIWDKRYYDYWKNGVIWEIPKWRKMWHVTEII